MHTDETPKDEKEKAQYWSVLHHKNVNAHDINADVGIPYVIRHEKDPLVEESSKKSDIMLEAEYGSASGEEDKKHRRKWSRVRELVQTNELFVHYLPENDDDKSLTESLSPAHKGAYHPLRGKWSDVNDAAYELTLRECLLLTLVLLGCGAIAYSYVFERWSILDSLYFTTVALTTVGYGDITPTTRSGRLFASIFAMGGIVILGLALGVVGSRLVEAEIEATEKMKESSSRVLEKAMRISRRHPRPRLASDQFGSSASLDSMDSVESMDDTVSSLPSFEEMGMRSRLCSGCRRLISLIQHHFPAFGPLLIGAFIIAKLEDWGWIDAIYFCVVTSTTIGFGDLAPVKPVARVCALFFIPLAVAAMGYILGQLASFIVEQRREEYYKRLLSKDLTIEDLDALDTDGDGGVSELEYLKFMLVAMKKVDAKLFDDLHLQFKKIDVVGDGKITKNDLKVMATRKMKKVHNKLALSVYKVWTLHLLLVFQQVVT
ncbi:hypothetical protein ACHAXN_007565 [Cyclotella atomus]